MKFAQLNLSPALCEEGFKNNSHNLPESPSPQRGYLLDTLDTAMPRIGPQDVDKSLFLRFRL